MNICAIKYFYSVNFDILKYTTEKFNNLKKTISDYYSSNFDNYNYD